MTVFACNNLSKKFDRDYLFENISFGLEEGERLGIIGRNGIGKTTLLKIIGGKETPDKGEIVLNKNITFDYLEQQTNISSNEPLIDYVMQAKKEIFDLNEEYDDLINTINNKSETINNVELEIKSKRLSEVNHKLDELNGWNLESEAKIILSKLGITDYTKTMNQLSGGQKKRVALAKVLLHEPDLLILDEPTNHLDADSVQWLQEKLMNTKTSLVFITHDRYFLDAISTRILEIDQKRIFNFTGNYQDYLEKKESIIEASNSAAEHNRSKLRMELAWLQKGAKARRTKAKSRIDWIAKMEDSIKIIKEKKIKIELGTSFMGQRIIDANYISKSIGGQVLFKDFTYIAKPKDRIGIIGPNACGKSTLLNCLAGKSKIDSGSLKIGDSVKIGYYTQEITNFIENQSIINSLKEIAEYIDCGIGRDRYITPRDLLLKFNFPTEQHTSLIETLSGGERRRLALLKILIDNPNIIFLDEPTNDLDIQTLTALEEYLDDFYGVLLIVSHDRAFLDRTVDFIWAFEENGKIKEYPGNYSYYLEKKEIYQSEKKKEIRKKDNKNIEKKKNENNTKKLSYLEQREFDLLEVEIPKLEKKKNELSEKIINIPPENYLEIEKVSIELAELEDLIDDKTQRWFELSEKFS